MNDRQWNQPPRHEKRGRFRWDRLILCGMGKIISYGIDLISSALTSEELQQVHHEEPTETAVPVITQVHVTLPRRLPPLPLPRRQSQF